MKQQVKPDKLWGPALPQHRDLYLQSLKTKDAGGLSELTEKLQPSLPDDTEKCNGEHERLYPDVVMSEKE